MQVGQWYGQADANKSTEVVVNGVTVTVRYCHWDHDDSPSEAVTQNFGKAPTGDEFYDWFYNRAIEVVALTGLGFEVYDSDSGTVFWEREA